MLHLSSRVRNVQALSLLSCCANGWGSSGSSSRTPSAERVPRNADDHHGGHARRRDLPDMFAIARASTFSLARSSSCYFHGDSAPASCPAPCTCVRRPLCIARRARAQYMPPTEHASLTKRSHAAPQLARSSLDHSRSFAVQRSPLDLALAPLAASVVMAPDVHHNPSSPPAKSSSSSSSDEPNRMTMTFVAVYRSRHVSATLLPTPFQVVVAAFHAQPCA